MSTIREQIVSAAILALATGVPVGVPAPVRTRLDSPSADQLPALTVYQGIETVETMREPKAGTASRGPVVRRSLLLSVEVLTKAGAGMQPDAAADPILAWATAALAAAGNFGGLANGPADEIGTKFEYEQAETSLCRATQTFRIEYQSRADDAETLT
ncbi:MAG TPA: hypothetical protein PLL30_13750 [Candidatus Krumholzibacteria bacterium]|nr:hypothetical protein [Candidatus Krumholzibacteria bacterium]HPD72829.1 hypothetical protein [Candidatus Krumholzibacteria bacterium]HRY42065.1 hypothetical protein [Candidatus Krumholzibacteria bacterium]